MEPTHREAIEPVVFQFLEWYSAIPALSSLLSFMLLDILTGIVAAVKEKKLDSKVSTKGMCVKVGMLLMAWFGLVLERFSGQGNIVNVMATLFCISEIVSIVENADRIGVPLPQSLRDTLASYRNRVNIERRKVPAATVQVQTMSDESKVEVKVQKEFKTDKP